MLKNYLTVAVRCLLRQRLYTAINILGLAIGLAGCFLIAGLVRHEFTFENMHANKDRIYRVITVPENYFVDHIANAPAPLALAIKEQCPEVEKITRLRRMRDVAMRVDQHVFKVETMFAADPEILDVYSLPLLAGNPETALADPFSILVSERLARTYFGDPSPIGRTVRVDGLLDFQVTGVFQDLTSNTQMRCDLLGSYSTLEAVGENTNDWTSLFSDYAYLLLREDAQIADLETKIKSIFSQHVDQETAARLDFKLQPLREIYLHSNGANELNPSGDMTLIYLSITIALLILIIGSVNFVNLSTARASRRAREVGLRKVMGAGRGHLARQFLGESVIVTIVAMFIGLALFELGKPMLAVFTGRTIDLGSWLDPTFLLSVLAIAVTVGLVAGSYPALLLSRFAPIISLRGGPISGSGKSLARRGLVVFQFTIAIALIALTTVVYQQTDYSENFNVGFVRDNVAIMEVEGRDAEWAASKCVLLKEELLRSGSVAEATASYAAPGEGRVWITEFRDAEQPKQEEVLLHILPVDYEYLDFYGLTVTQGRSFFENMADDASNKFILTESAVKAFDLGQPVGARLASDEEEFTIVGVVADFNVLPSTYRDFPTALQIVPDAYSRVAVKLPPGDLATHVSALESGWQKVLPDQPFNYMFLDDVISRVYAKRARLGTMGVVFATLAVFVACLGILGLASYAVERRTKEVGIRKVLGASFAGVIRLLSNETLVLILIANALALPLVWYIGNLWLEEFTHRIDIGPVVFVIGGGALLVVAMITVASQAIRAARANPVEALKYE